MTAMRQVAQFSALLTFSGLLAAVSGTGRAAAAAPAKPFALLYDTGVASASPLSAADLSGMKGWKRVPENTLKHGFTGDAVLLNNRIIMVLRKKSRGAEVYGWGKRGPEYRLLMALQAESGKDANSLAGMTVKENSTTAVAVEARFETADKAAVTAAFRITVGDRILEIRAGKGCRRVALSGPLAYVVVPDFFADDMVYSAALPDLQCLALPTENFFIGMFSGGNAMAMCAWKGHDRNVDLAFSGEGNQRKIARCEVDCPPGKTLSVAVIDSTGLWHGRKLSAADAGKKTSLDWKQPFAAKWRGCFARRDGTSRSCGFPVGDGTAIQVPATGQDDPRRAVSAFLAYPFDRSVDTPLDSFLPVDVMRSTLGMGPCEYILSSEGLAGDGVPPTPNEITKWVEKKFKRKRAARYADDIGDKLKSMVAHVAHGRERVSRYETFARELRKLCDAEKTGENQAVIEEMIAILNYLDQAITQGQRGMGTNAELAKLADSVLALARENAPVEKCRDACTAIRAIGLAQDRTLSRCRMSARRLKQVCRMAAVQKKAAGLVRAVKARVLKQLSPDAAGTH